MFGKKQPVLTQKEAEDAARGRYPQLSNLTVQSTKDGTHWVIRRPIPKRGGEVITIATIRKKDGDWKEDNNFTRD